MTHTLIGPDHNRVDISGLELPQIPNECGSKYSAQIRLEACAYHMISGRFSLTSKALNIPERTLYDWSKTEWWQTATLSLREQTKHRTLAGLDRVVELGLSEAADRLEKGDVKLTKDGDQVRVPVDGKSAATIAAIAIDKRQILLNQPTSIRGESTGMDDLARQFKDLARRMDEKVVGEG